MSDIRASKYTIDTKFCAHLRCTVWTKMPTESIDTVHLEGFWELPSYPKIFDSKYSLLC